MAKRIKLEKLGIFSKKFITNTFGLKQVSSEIVHAHDALGRPIIQCLRFGDESSNNKSGLLISDDGDIQLNPPLLDYNIQDLINIGRILKYDNTPMPEDLKDDLDSDWDN